MAAKAQDPHWEQALAYAAGHTPIEAAVAARIDGTPDVLYNHLLSVTRWLAYSTQRLEWRSKVFSRLGNLFVAPNQYPLIRERVAAALVGSRDRSSLLIFQKALQSPDPDIRRLASLGIGIMREPKAVSALAPLLADEDSNVQLAAGLGLGAIGTDEAYEEMVLVLTQGSERLRQAISETFAAIPEEGYPILYDAINNEDMMLRRAAVFGLRRVPTSWALIEIYRAFLEDEQWYVRSAAQQAFQDMQLGDGTNTVRHYPAPESINWLREWIADQGEDAAALNPDDALSHALREGDPVLKTISATAIGQLGLVTNVADLYEALLYRDATVRDAAHRALADIQARIGEALPAPA
jgi:HEAT repeat protein